MAFVHDDVLDNGPQYIVTNGERLCYTIGEAADYTEANTDHGTGSNKRAGYMDDGGGGLAITLVNGSSSGRAAQVADASSSVNATVNSAANAVTHWAIIDITNTKLLITGSLTAGITTSTSSPISVTAAAQVYVVPDPS